jgi:hypothetical protein
MQAKFLAMPMFAWPFAAPAVVPGCAAEWRRKANRKIGYRQTLSNHNIGVLANQ